MLKMLKMSRLYHSYISCYIVTEQEKRLEKNDPMRYKATKLSINTLKQEEKAETTRKIGIG